MAASKTEVIPTAKTDPTKNQLEWVQMRNEMSGVYGSSETSQERFYKKFRQNPFIPIGCLVTIGVLGYGLFSFRKGRSQVSQKMMRWRIVAQGLTIVAIGAGVAISGGE